MKFAFPPHSILQTYCHASNFQAKQFCPQQFWVNNPVTPFWLPEHRPLPLVVPKHRQPQKDNQHICKTFHFTHSNRALIHPNVLKKWVTEDGQPRQGLINMMARWKHSRNEHCYLIHFLLWPGWLKAVHRFWLFQVLYTILVTEDSEGTQYSTQVSILAWITQSQIIFYASYIHFVLSRYSFFLPPYDSTFSLLAQTEQPRK